MTLELLVDIIATIIGFVSIILLMRLNKDLGGKMSTAVRLFTGGIIFMVLAFAWTMIFGHIGVALETSGGMHMDGMDDTSRYIDMHHILMAIGMIFLIFSARKFSSLVSTT